MQRKDRTSGKLTPSIVSEELPKVVEYFRVIAEGKERHVQVSDASLQ